MMRQIQPIGNYMPMDADGYVVNETSRDHIVPPWSAVVDDIVEAYVAACGKDLLGVYLRGSLPAGRAVPGFSDIDAFALLDPADSGFIRWEEVSWVEAFNRQMRARYDFVTRVDLNVATFDERFGEHNPRVQMVVKTQSLCVHGRDVIPEIAKQYRPGREMMLHVRWLPEELAELVQLADADADASAIRRKCSEVMKVMVRAGFELVMEAEQRFTSCLYWCHQSFARHHPDKASLMEQALLLYLNPPGNAAAVLPVARELGEWLVERARVQLSDVM